MEKELSVRLADISKNFGATRALKDVSIEFLGGEIHAILGENGAGKSTLINILDNVLPDFEGSIYFNGTLIPHRQMKDFFRDKLGVVHQEFPLVPYMSVAENLFLGEMPHGKFNRILWSKLYKAADELMESLQIKINVKEKVMNIGAGERQLVSIAHALHKNPALLLLDEATSTLTDNEVNIVFDLLHKLAEKGTAIAYISHRIEEIFEIADRVSVFRDGSLVGTKKTSDTDRVELIRMMAGRDMSNQFPERRVCGTSQFFRAEHLTGKAFKDCSFEVRKGEILGIAGLVGAGRPELIKAVFGAEPISEGKMHIDDKEVRIQAPKDAMKLGIYFIPSDRRKEGLFNEMNVRDNITLALINNYTKLGSINHEKESQVTNEYIHKLQIKTQGENQLVKALSGGNQQKVIISRWLSGNGRLFLFDEPTRGLDVGVKYDVYELMNQIKYSGGAVVMVSSELPELLAMSDRVIAMYEGKIVAEMDNRDNQLDQETVLAAIMNEHESINK